MLTFLLLLAMGATEPDRLTVVPVGEVDADVLRVLSNRLCVTFAISVAVAEAVTPPTSAYSALRNQFRSSDILDFLATRFVKRDSGHFQGHNCRFLAVTGVDLYAAGLSYVFGQADMVDRIAVVSLARLQEEFYRRPPSRTRFLGRAVREAIHELGHTYGLPHCPSSSCVMYFSENLPATDRKTSNFCPRCSAVLPRRSAELR